VLQLLAGLGLSGTAAGQTATSEPAAGDRSLRGEAFLGYHSWDELGQLTPEGSGSFDTGGFNLGVAGHWRVRDQQHGDLWLGVDFAFFSNESDIRYLGEDLLSRGMYITPSIKWLLERGEGPRYSLDLGLGFYLVDIAVLPADEELWEDPAFGGYIGASLELPLGGSTRRRGLSLSAKIHMFDLGEVGDEEILFGQAPVLGSNAGSLAGPVLMFQFGYHWY
jgi:hypothetical protein